MAFKRLKSQYLSTKARLFSNLSTLTLASILGVMLLTIASVVFFATQVPSPQDLVNRNIAQATKIYDRDGELLYDIFSIQNRTPIKLEDVPKHVKEATIAIEDKDFYKHQGFSLSGIIRAIFDTIRYQRIEGGSTLTQQLVKNALLSGERTLIRKVKEFILAVQVERAYAKDQILEMYLNEVPYGGTAYGIEAAANLYFGKHAKDLNLAEAALLAGLPQRPSVYSPYGSHPELSKERQKQVLRRMIEDGYINKEQAEASLKEEVTYRTAQNEVGFKAPHFVLYVKQKLIEQFGDRLVEQGGLRVTTSLDYKLQEKAQKVIKDEIETLSKSKVGNGASIVLDPKTGQILSMVGSKDYFAKDYDGNVNVTVSKRQPGSATKPITYAKALEKGYTASQVLIDVATEFPGGLGKPFYKPVNYDGQFRGPIQLRYALGNSINLAAVKMLAQVGVRDVMEQAFRMGMSDWEPTEENVNNVGLSLTLGGREVKLLELTAAFATLANQGIKQEPISILKVTDSKGKVLYEHKQSDGQKVLDEGITFIISDILSDNGARTAVFGSNSILNVSGYRVAVKTGTTDEKRDNWAIGYNPEVVVGVWVGNNDNSPMDPAVSSGVTGASPIWNKIIKAALDGKASSWYSQPGNVSYIEIDGLMGGKVKDGSPVRKEYYIKGTEPNEAAKAYQNRKVCRNNPHRLANDDEEGDGKDVIVLEEKDPTGANKWQEAIDKWVLSAAEPKLVGASKGCSNVPGFSAGSGGVISIVNVANGANVPRVFDVLALVNSPNGVKKVTWTIDGSLKKTQSSEPFALHVEFPQGDRGSHTITATLEDNAAATHSHSIGVTVAL